MKGMNFGSGMFVFFQVASEEELITAFEKQDNGRTDIGQTVVINADRS